MCNKDNNATWGITPLKIYKIGVFKIKGKVYSLCEIGQICVFEAD